MKSLFKCRICGDIHYGASAPAECPTCKNHNAYEKAARKDVDKLLLDLGAKRIGRCTVCNDVHLGKTFPEICPTCSNKNVYVEINQQEIVNLLG